MITPKCLYYQESFLKGGLVIQTRLMRNKRNLKFHKIADNMIIS